MSVTEDTGAALVRSQPTCGATKVDGGVCESRILLDDGRCVAHSTVGSSAVERGRQGGIASGEVRRALANSARERLRKLADEDEDLWALIRAAYYDALKAVDREGNPDFRARVSTADAFLDQAYGKLPQAIVGDDEKPLTFVLDSLLRRAQET